MNATFERYSLGTYLPYVMVMLMFFMPVSSLFKSISLGLVCLAVLSSSSHREDLWTVIRSPWCFAPLVFFLFILLSSLWSPASGHDILNAINKYSKFMVFPFCVVGFMTSKTRRWSLVAFMAAMLLTAVISILQAYGLVNLHGDGLIDPSHVFHSHIMTGFLMAFASYYSAYLFFNEDNRRMRWLYLGLALLFSYVALFLNIGRTGYVIYFILLILLCLQRFTLKQALIGVFLGVSVFGIIYTQSSVMNEHIGKLFSDYHNYQKNIKSTSLGFRLQFYNYSKSLFEARPLFGHGTASFSHLFDVQQPIPEWGPRLLEPHSEYWLTAVEQGAVGFGLLMAFFASLLWNAMKLKSGKSLMLAAVIASMAACLSDSFLFYGSSGYFLIVFGALGYGEYFESLKKPALTAANNDCIAPRYSHQDHAGNGLA